MGGHQRDSAPLLPDSGQGEDGTLTVQEPLVARYSLHYHPRTLHRTHPLWKLDLSTEAASWLPEGGTALLLYEGIRNSPSPKETLLEFMESAYLAGAKSAGWDIDAFRTHPPAREAAKLTRGK